MKIFKILIILCLISLSYTDISAEISFKYGGSGHSILHVLPSISSGLMVSIIGEVRILKVEENEYVEAIEYKYVDFDDIVQLQSDSSIELIFDDNSHTIIGPYPTITWIMLKPLEYSP